MAFFAMVLPTGFGDSLVQRKTLSDAHKDSAFWLSLGFGSLCTGAAILCGHVVATIYGKPALDTVMPVLASRILFDALGIVPNSLIARTMNFRILVMRTAVTTLAAGMLAVLLALDGRGVWALILSQVATAALSTGVVFVASGYRPRSLGSRAALRDLSHYGLFATGTRGVQFLSGQADQLLIGLFLGTEAVGLYAFAKRVFTIAIDLTSGVLTAVAHPAAGSSGRHPSSGLSHSRSSRGSPQPLRRWCRPCSGRSGRVPPFRFRCCACSVSSPVSAPSRPP